MEHFQSGRDRDGKAIDTLHRATARTHHGRRDGAIVGQIQWNCWQSCVGPAVCLKMAAILLSTALSAVLYSIHMQGACALAAIVHIDAENGH